MGAKNRKLTGEKSRLTDHVRRMALENRRVTELRSRLKFVLCLSWVFSCCFIFAVNVKSSYF
ncbi:hypothetical protein HanRHA438_Chr11g0489341 [Helianthus annuus]|nr:hypothetical protein HanRHA438_Chr11g0489341 [Helianthus annuus]